MTYQTAYKLLVAAYKSAKGIMPEGLDLLKIKQKARQKVIDAKKVIKFPQGGKDKINPFEPRPKFPKNKEGIEKLIKKGDVKIGQAPKTTKRKPAVDPKLTQEENIKRIMAENKAAAKRLQEKMNKPEKSLGEKLRDYDGDPDAMASGGKVKKPFRSKVVDFLGGPAVVEAELGLSGLLEVYNLLGMPLMRDGGKVKKKRKHNDNVDDEDIGEGESKKRFLNKMPRPRNYPNLPEEEIILDKMPRPKRSDGIMELATGGMTNIGDTYDNNPTLQAQYPNKQDYLDMFAQQTTTTTPQTNTTTQATTSTIAPINPIKPIIPIPQNSGDSGGITTIQPRATKEDLTFRERMANLNLQMGVPVKEEEISFFDKIKQFSPTYQFMKAGKQLKDRGQQAIEDFFAAREAAKAAEVARIARQNLAASMGSDAGPGEGAGTFGASVNEATGARGSGTGFSDYS